MDTYSTLTLASGVPGDLCHGDRNKTVCGRSTKGSARFTCLECLESLNEARRSQAGERESKLTAGNDYADNTKVADVKIRCRGLDGADCVQDRPSDDANNEDNHRRDSSSLTAVGVGTEEEHEYEGDNILRCMVNWSQQRATSGRAEVDERGAPCKAERRRCCSREI